MRKYVKLTVQWWSEQSKLCACIQMVDSGTRHWGQGYRILVSRIWDPFFWICIRHVIMEARMSQDNQSATAVKLLILLLTTSLGSSVKHTNQHLKSPSNRKAYHKYISNVHTEPVCFRSLIIATGLLRLELSEAKALEYNVVTPITSLMNHSTLWSGRGSLVGTLDGFERQK